jgi:hypothetical protein
VHAERSHSQHEISISKTVGHHFWPGLIARAKIWGQRKNEKKSSLPHPTQNLKEKKSRHFECMLSLPIGCMKFLFPKLFVTIFDLG